MRLYVQWTTDPPGDFEPLDIRDWRGLRKRDVVRDALIDADPGWVMALNVQGVVFNGFDHYAVVERGRQLVVTVWNDDTGDEWFTGNGAQVWRFSLPSKRRAHGQSAEMFDTEQYLDIYTDDEERAAIWRTRTTTGGPVTVHPWADFVEPDPRDVRHGIMVEDQAYYDHRDKRTPHHWDDEDWG
jgi:hypothetical protein